MQEATSTRNKSPEDAESIGSLLRKADIARLCNVSTRTVESWLHSRKIPSVKIGRTVRFRWHAVEDALLKYERQVAN